MGKTIVRFVIMVLIVFFAPTALGDIIHVDADATGANDGGSWENAFVYLQDALAVAGDSDEVRVAQGVYKPDLGAGIATGDRNATFQLINGVSVKGGYAGFGEVDPDVRNVELYETILSGDLEDNDADVSISVMLTEPTRDENSIHVVTGSGTDATAVLDGFTVTAGHASGVTSWAWVPDETGEWYYFDRSYTWLEFDLYGAGMFNYSGSPTVTECTFVKNAAIYGGGMSNHEGSNPIVTNCVFTRNIAGWGGGIENAQNSGSTVHGCTFSDNIAGTANRLCNDGADSLVGIGGGFASVVRCSSTLTECTFTGNRTVPSEGGDGGGGVGEMWGSTSVIDDCVFVSNTARFGGALFINSSNHAVRHCVFRENSSAAWGGAVYTQFAELTLLQNCDFYNNRSSRYAGAIGIYESVLTSSHCVFTENGAGITGGAVDSTNSDSQFTNCIFGGNSSPKGGVMWVGNNSGGESGSCALTNCTLVDNDTYGIYISNITPTLENCIVWGNTPSQFYGSAGVTYSDVEGGYTGVGNINLAPAFVWRANGDYHLRSLAGAWDKSTQSWVASDPTSPCIDMGNPLSIFIAELWPHGGRINMGAYGGTAEASMSLSAVGNIANYNNDDGVDYADFSVLSEEWQSDVLPSKADMNRDGHVGMGDLLIFADNWIYRN